MIYHDAMTTTRERTPEGFLKARAIISRAGPFQYKPTELPETLFSMGTLNPNDTVTVMRTKDTIAHPATAETIRRAPITMAHPEKNVTASSWKNHTVGHVIGDPFITDDGLIMADILIADEDAARAVEQGKDQLSVGYEHGIMRDENDNLLSDGPLRVNHIAIVGQGRAGGHVRIQDEKPEEVEEDNKMTDEQVSSIKAAMKDAVATAISEAKQGDEREQAVADAVETAMEPVIERINDLTAAQQELVDEAQDEADEAELEKLLENAANEFADQIRDEERTRYQVLQDAAPLLKGVSSESLNQMDSGEILKVALKDVVPDADKRSPEYLSGMLAGVIKQRDTFTSMSQPTPAPNPTSLPQGIVGRDSLEESDPRSAYINALKKSFMDKLGTMNNTD